MTMVGTIRCPRCRGRIQVAFDVEMPDDDDGRTEIVLDADVEHRCAATARPRTYPKGRRP